MPAVEQPAHTFVFADLAGFTALTEAHGDEHAADMAADFYGRVRQLLEDCAGQEIKQLGDAMMLRLDDPLAAVGLAARIVSEATDRHGALGVRVGMHTGPAVERNGDWFGSTVNLAARVSGRALGGEVLLTGATKEAAGDALEDRLLRNRGHQRFKNVGAPVELWALVVEPDHGETGLPLDPVCRMAVDPLRSDQRAVHQGVEYHFCSEQCRQRFVEQPGTYAGRQHRDGDVLVSDASRARVAAHLGRAFERGRFDNEELESRLDRALAARTRAELRDVTADLPRRPRRRVGPFRGTWLLLRRMTRRTRFALRGLRRRQPTLRG